MLNALAGSRGFATKVAASLIVTAALVTAAFFVVNNAFAAVAVTPATNGTGVSADTAADGAAPAYTTLGNIVISETSDTDFAASQTNATLRLKPQNGWEFNPGVGSVSHAANAPGGEDITSASISVNSTVLVVTFSTDGSANKSDSITISGIQVRPGTGVGLPSDAIVRPVANPGTAIIAGITDGVTSFGELSQVAGVAAELGFSTEPGGAAYGALLSPQPVVKTKDQFGNDSVVGLGVNVNVAMAISSGSGTLQGTASIDIGTAGGNGTATFTDLSVDAVGTGKAITASAPGFASAVSASFDIARPVLTVTADNKTKTYASADPAFTVQYSGFVGGDDESDIDTAPTADVPAAHVNVGPYAIVASGGADDLYDFAYVDGTLTIDPKPITVTPDAQTKVYGDTDPGFTYTNDALESGDVFTGSLARVAGENAGSYAIEIGTLSAGANYALNLAAASLSITPKPLTVTAATDTKVYDGTTASIGVPTLTAGALVGGDTVTWTQAFATKHAGTLKVLVPAGTVNDGNGGANYSVTFVNDTTGTITAASITVTAVTDTREYDNTTASAGTPGITGAIMAGDTANFTQAFDAEHVGTGKTLAPAGSVIDGNSGLNYAVTFANDTTGEVTIRSITVNAVADTKVYDGTAASTVSPVIISGSLAAGDSATWSQTYDDANAGTGKTLTPTGSVTDGNGGANYMVSFNINTAGEITVRSLMITADDKAKVYGAADPALTYQITSGSLVLGDVITAGSLVRAAGENVASYAITEDIAFSAGANYAVAFAPGTFDITKKTLVVTAEDKAKVYGDADPAFTVSYSGFVSGDDEGDLDTAPTADVPAAHVNVGPYAIAASGGADDNYDLSYTDGTLTITAKPIAVTADAKTKVYGDADPALTYANDPLVGGDTFSGALDRVAGESVGTRAITQGTLTAGSNYAIAFTGNDLTITERPITVSAVAATKVYDAADTSSVSPVIISGSLAFSDAATWTQTYDNKNVGAGKTLTPAGSVTDGNGGANYDVTFAINTAGEITAKDLTVSATGENKVYDGTTNATVALTTDAITGDAVTATSTAAAFASANAGAGIAVTVTGISISGADAGNYTLLNTAAAATADITKADQAITFGALLNKTLGDSDFSVSATSDSGLAVGFAAAGACTVSGGTVHLTGPGGCSITASQAGDSNYNAAPDVAQFFTIGLTATGGGSGSPSTTTGGGSVLGSSSTGGNGAIGNGTTGGATGGGQVLGASTFNFAKSLRLGMRNNDVMELQKALAKLGYFKVKPTGYFGPVTLAAAKAYQKANGIPATGFVGPLTRASLNANATLALGF